MDLTQLSTSELVEELATRKGVQQERVDPHGPYAMDLGDHGKTGTGPVIILVISD